MFIVNFKLVILIKWVQRNLVKSQGSLNILLQSKAKLAIQGLLSFWRNIQESLTEDENCSECWGLNKKYTVYSQKHLISEVLCILYELVSSSYCWLYISIFALYSRVAGFTCQIAVEWSMLEIVCQKHWEHICITFLFCHLMGVAKGPGSWYSLILLSLCKCHS